MTLVDALQAALGVEHQAVYGYGLAAAHLTGRDYDRALALLAAAKVRRDRLAGLIAAHRANPAPGAPAYAPPRPVRTRADAVELCVAIETAAAGTAWDLCTASGPSSAERALGAQWLTDAAVAAAQWSGGGDHLAALPGQPA